MTEDLSKLTSFITPFGQFYFTKLPFGIAAAPEHKTQNRGLKGVVCYADDVLVWGLTQEEHDAGLQATLEKILHGRKHHK